MDQSKGFIQKSKKVVEYYKKKLTCFVHELNQGNVPTHGEQCSL